MVRELGTRTRSFISGKTKIGFSVQCRHEICRYIGLGLVDSQAVYLRLRSLTLTTLVSVEVQDRGYNTEDPQCFRASRIRIRIFLSASKNSKKNLDSYCFVTSFGLIVFEKRCKCTFKK
jgi:hypothetical protein